jgi:hypothetical protein
MEEAEVTGERSAMEKDPLVLKPMPKAEKLKITKLVSFKEETTWLGSSWRRQGRRLRS